MLENVLRTKRDYIVKEALALAVAQSGIRLRIVQLDMEMAKGKDGMAIKINFDNIFVIFALIISIFSKDV